MAHHDDFKVEPIKGLPELPPEGEHILWQGAPSWWALARDALMVRWVMGYFVALGVWRAIDISDRVDPLTAAWGAVPFLILGLIACAILSLIAWVQAWATVYTITNRRVALRIGAALTVTLNLPFRRIQSADLDLRRDGSGTIALTLEEPARLSYLVCWPHVRPWRIARTNPALRCIPDAERVAGLLAQAAATRVGVATEHHPAVAVAAE